MTPKAVRKFLRSIPLILLLASTCFAQVTARPSTDADGGANPNLGCTGSNLASTKMPLSYDAAGVPTFSIQDTAGDTIATRYMTRVFSGFSSSSSAYTTLTLNVYASSAGWRNNGNLPGNACVAYSIDNGVTWTSLICDGTGLDTGGNGFGPQFYTATLNTSQDITKVQVGVCTQGAKQIKTGGGGGGTGTQRVDDGGNDNDGIGEDSIAVNDIYLLGTTTPTTGGNGSSAGNGARGVVVSN